MNLLRQKGIDLKFPHSSGIATSKYKQMRELRVQHQGRPFRVLFAFDPKRHAVLLIGGEKTGNPRWYEIFVPWRIKSIRNTSENWRMKRMTRARNFRELENKMSAERRARVAARVKATLENMALDELRAARQLTQEHLAEILNVKQAAVSKLERRTDMYVSTLGRFIEAMGGQLEIRAVFPDGIVRITQFSQDISAQS